jgi:hypothetical protein
MDLNDQDLAARILLRDHDAKFTRSFDEVFGSEGGQALRTPIRAPKANASAERWVRTVRAECLDWTLVCGRRHLLRLLRGYVRHYNQQRPHRGLALAVPEAGERKSPQVDPREVSVAMCSAASSTSITRSQHDESGFPRPTAISEQAYSYDNAGRLTEVDDTPTAAGCTIRSYGGAVALRRPRHAEAADSALDQIAKASSSKATTTRRFAGSSAASSQCPRRTFCTNACPAMMAVALRSCLSPRIGLSGAFSRPWSASTRLLAYRSVRCHAAGSSSSSTPG